MLRLATLLLVLLPCVALPGELRDPMRPSYVKPARLAHAAHRDQPLILQAVFGNESYRIAVINGKSVESGSRIGTTEVLGIKADSVSLRRGALRWTIRLPAAPLFATGG